MVLRCDRRLDGDLGTHRGRVAVKIAVESEQTREREPCLGLAERRQPIQWRRSAWSTRTLSWLLLCEPPSKERFGVVDAAPTRTQVSQDAGDVGLGNSEVSDTRIKP